MLQFQTQVIALLLYSSLTPPLNYFDFHDVAVVSSTLFKSSIFLKPVVRNHSRATSSPCSIYTFTAPDHVARPQSTPLNLAPTSCANFNVSWNNSADTPHLNRYKVIV